MSVSKIASTGVGGGVAAAKSPPIAKPPPADKVRDRQLNHDRLLHRKEAAHHLNVSLSWLDKSRLSGVGPEYIRLGGSVRYAFSDLEKFLAANRRSSTSQR